MGRFRIPAVVFEGVPTGAGDDRIIEPGAVTHRALPLSLKTLFEDGPGGHVGARVSGRIDTLERVDASAMIDEAIGQPYGLGTFTWIAEGEFTDEPDGQMTERLVGFGALRGVSVDFTAVEVETEVLEEDEDGWPTKWLDHFTAAEIASATVCAVQALRGATIELIDGADVAPATQEDVAVVASAALPAFQIINDGPGCGPCASSAEAGVPAALTASGGPLHPPAAWFSDPALTGPTALTVTDDGRVFGHVATWGTCHVGNPSSCVTPPHSATDYSYFHVGALRTAEGTDVAVGHLFIEGPHADLHASAGGAQDHYANTCATWADVCSGEDAHGIWISGAVRPDVSEEQLRVARSSPLSGDWRRIGTGYEMVAALSVNTGGFPVPRARALAASGVPVALVAAGALAQPTLHRPTQQHVTSAARELLEELRASRRELAAERLLTRIRRA